MTRFSVGTLAALLATSPAMAQTGEPETLRRGLVQLAEAASAAGHHGEAIGLAERAALTRETPSLRWFIAREHRTAGHRAEAIASAETCVRLAERDPTVRSRDELLRECGAIVLALRTAPAVVPVTPPAVERRVAREVVRSSGPGPWPWVVMGLGAVAVGVGVGLHVASDVARDERDAGCDEFGCDPATQDHDGAYRSLGIGRNVAVGLGVAAVVGGVTWLLVGRRSGAAPAMTASRGGVVLRW